MLLKQLLHFDRCKVLFTLSVSDRIINGTIHTGSSRNLCMQIFVKVWVEYPFNPIALVSTGVTKESLFCNAIVNAQCERNLKLEFLDTRTRK